MRHVEGHFTGTDDITLYSQQWLPESDPRAVVLLVHGVGEHSGRYMKVVRPLVEQGYAVCSYDHRGHGHSPGRRVYVDSWAQYRGDLDAYVRVVGDVAPDRPVVLYGHSMGSLVALDYLIESPPAFAGAIISGVATEPIGVGGPLQIALARMLTGVLPTLSVPLGIKAESLTRDPEALAEFAADTLCTSKATVRWGSESLAVVERIKSGMPAVDVPMLVIHGEDDPLNSVAGAKTLYETIASTDKRLRTYPDTLHEPHNDLAHSDVAADVCEWVAHIAETHA